MEKVVQQRLMNKSFSYVYPMIEDVVNYEDNLLACYIGDVDKPQYQNHIFLRYKFEGSITSAYLKFEEEIQRCDLLIDFYDIRDEERDTVMFVFKVPEEYQEDYDKFKNSKYSTFSDKYKERILHVHVEKTKNKANEKILKGVLYQTKEFKIALEEKIGHKVTPDMEFSSKWDKDSEIFNKNK